ncbi:putative pyruvate dehydrogenase E1 component subunit alpha [Blattella germanica]|nr:putative pyruvate dehydrogenase E1 component subunit alpha [Blattella germanica]
MIPNCVRTLGKTAVRRQFGTWYQTSKDVATRMAPDFMEMSMQAISSFFTSSKKNYATEATFEIKEACAVGIKASLRPQDSVITAYRAHGWSYVMGVPPMGVLAELTGRSSGIAFAAKYSGTDGVCVALYGDGAANQGQVFEAYNIAKLWDIPCIFVCENNGYGMGTSVDRASASTNYYTRGDYVPGMWVQATRFSVDYCTSGKGPIVLEMATYRYSGHSMSDPGTSYRTREEIQEVRQTRDPVTSFKEKIIDAELVTADEIKKLDSEIRASVDETMKKAKADKEIGLEELTADIYADCREPSIRGATPWDPLQHRTVGKAVNL